MNSICVVGGGASGVSLLYNLSKSPSLLDALSIKKIDIFDESSFDGGYAYRTMDENHIINMSSSRMSVDIYEKNNFSKWLVSNNYSVNVVPRKLYAKYLKDTLHSAIERIRSLGISIKMVDAKVSDMDVVQNKGVVLHPNTGDVYSHVFLATGHNPPKRPKSRFPILDPESLTEKMVSKASKVCVLGTSLTAIDAILKINKQNPNIEIHLISRNGCFPKVQPLASQAKNDSFVSFIKNGIGSMSNITAERLVCLLNDGLNEHYDGNEKIVVSHEAKKEPHIDECINNLESDISRSIYSESCINSYLDSVHETFCDAWSNMSNKEKSLFMKKYNSSWMLNRHAMPLFNAIKIRNLLRFGKIKVSCMDIFHTEVFDGFIQKEGFDFIINCTSPSYAASDNTLISNLIDKRILKSDSNGGALVEIEYEDTFYLVGQLNKGKNFYTAAIEAVTESVRSNINLLTESSL